MHKPLATMLAACLLATLALSACHRRAPAPSAEPSTKRMTSEGPVIGIRGNYGNVSWLGIPFAAPPVGDRRWREPIPPPSRNADYLATQLPSACPQIASPFAGVTDVDAGEPAGVEDCLYLNIYAPTETAGPLPVMFWIHGGGNVIGHSGFYDGGNLAQTENVVVVVVQYRLGPLGWLRHASLREDASELAQSGNFGTLDMIRGLEWVRDNIAAFGGDPDRVTVFGESAGGRNAISLLLAPPARGLFHRAIVQSGGTYLFSPDSAENFSDDAEAPGEKTSSNELLISLIIGEGIAQTREGAKIYLGDLSAAEQASYLRSKSPEELLAAYPNEGAEGLIDVPAIFSEGTVVSSGDALDNLAAGNAADVPVIFGTNRDENKIFMFANPAYVRNSLGFLPRLRDPDLFNATAEVMSKLWAVNGAVNPADARLRHGGAPSYVYRWDWDEEPSFLGTDLAEMIGAAHGLEIPFIFGHFDLGPEGSIIFDDDGEAARLELSRQMMSYWANFARTGAPGQGTAGDLPAWRAWSAEAGAERILVFDTEAGGGISYTAEVPQRDPIIAGIETDERLATAERRCQLYRDLAVFARELTEEEVRDKGCAIP